MENINLPETNIWHITICQFSSFRIGITRSSVFRFVQCNTRNEDHLNLRHCVSTKRRKRWNLRWIQRNMQLINENPAFSSVTDQLHASKNGTSHLYKTAIHFLILFSFEFGEMLPTTLALHAYRLHGLKALLSNRPYQAWSSCMGTWMPKGMSCIQFHAQPQRNSSVQRTSLTRFVKQVNTKEIKEQQLCFMKQFLFHFSAA